MDLSRVLLGWMALCKPCEIALVPGRQCVCVCFRERCHTHTILEVMRASASDMQRKLSQEKPQHEPTDTLRAPHFPPAIRTTMFRQHSTKMHGEKCHRTDYDAVLFASGGTFFACTCRLYLHIRKPDINGLLVFSLRSTDMTLLEATPFALHSRCQYPMHMKISQP